MTGPGTQARRLTVALIAAYVLVLQALLGGAVAGGHAGAMALDRAVHLTLCEPGGSGVPQPAGQGSAQGGAHLPDCCIPGCQFLPLAGGATPSAMLPVIYAGTRIAPQRTDGVSIAALSAERSESRPRAPPVTLRTT